MILHFLQDGIHLKVEFAGCDPNYNMCLVGTPGGPTVQIMCLADFFSIFHCNQFSLPIYTSCKPHGKS
jgi:hypothetical protein